MISSAFASSLTCALTPQQCSGSRTGCSSDASHWSKHHHFFFLVCAVSYLVAPSSLRCCSPPLPLYLRDGAPHLVRIL